LQMTENCSCQFQYFCINIRMFTAKRQTIIHPLYRCSPECEIGGEIYPLFGCPERSCKKFFHKRYLSINISNN